MAGITNLMFALVLTTLTGSVLFVTWCLSHRFFDEPGYLPTIYLGLRITQVAFLVPVAYLILRLGTIDILTGAEKGHLFSATGKMRETTMAAWTVWLIGALICLAQYWWTSGQWCRIRQKEAQADERLEKLLETSKVKVGVKCPVKLYVLQGLPTSFTYGIKHPEIWLPGGCTDAEYEMMLIHELLHIKHYDIFWGCCMVAATTAHWFNPVVWFLNGQIKRWDEAYDDYVSCQHIKDSGAYCELLLKQSQAGQYYASRGMNVRSFAWKQSKVKERVMRMSRFRKMEKRRKVSAWVAAVCFVMCSVVGAGTATGIVVEAREAWFYDTVEIRYEEPQVHVNTLEEFTISADELEGYTFVEEEASDAVTLGAKTINWTLGKESVRLTAGFNATAGGAISITLYVEPEDLAVRVGIENPDGSYTLVRGAGEISHKFSVTQTGTYRVVVINDSDDDIVVSVTGVYNY